LRRGKKRLEKKADLLNGSQKEIRASLTKKKRKGKKKLPVGRKTSSLFCADGRSFYCSKKEGRKGHPRKKKKK